MNHQEISGKTKSMILEVPVASQIDDLSPKGVDIKSPILFKTMQFLHDFMDSLDADVNYSVILHILSSLILILKFIGNTIFSKHKAHKILINLEAKELFSKEIQPLFFFVHIQLDCIL